MPPVTCRGGRSLIPTRTCSPSWSMSSASPSGMPGTPISCVSASTAGPGCAPNTRRRSTRKPVQPTARRSNRPPGRPHHSRLRGCLSPRCCRRSLLVRKEVGPLRVTSGPCSRQWCTRLQRLCLAASAADVRHVARHRASPLHGIDRGRPVASAAPGGAGRTRGPGRGGLEKGSKLHVLSDAQGIPLAVAVSGTNMHDSLALKPRSSAAYPPSGPAGDHGGADPSNSARTRRTSPPNTWPGCASAGSSPASRGPASSPANASVGAAGCLTALSPMISFKSVAFPHEGEVEIRRLARVGRVHHR